MDTDGHEWESDLTEVVIGAAFEVANVPGEKLIVELKCVDRIANEHLAQCINYLKASRLGVALLIKLPEAKGGMETSPPGSLIWYITLAFCPVISWTLQ